MTFQLFRIPAHGCRDAEAELNNFLRSHRVLTVVRNV